MELKYIKITYRKLSRAILFLILILSISPQVKAIDIKEIADKKNVLFISSYSESFITVPDQIKGMKSVFQDQYYLDIEYMDMKRLETEENKKLFYVSLKYKLNNIPPYDAIIVGDDAALAFAMEYQEELFFETPIVFMGINDHERAKKAADNPYITGILEETSLVENIEIAKRFNPDAKKVIGIVDSTLTGEGDQQQLNQAATVFPDLKFDMLNSSNYSYDEFAGILRDLDKDTIMIFQSMNIDNTGAYTSLDEAFVFLKENTRIPVYRATIGGVGKGLLGGKMIDYEAFGKLSAQLVIDVLNGKAIETIELIEETPYYYIFDYELIEKFDIDKKLIPTGSELINRPQGILEKYPSIVLPILITLAVLMIVVTILGFDNIKRRSIENKLKISNEKLTETYKNLSLTEETLRKQYKIIKNQATEVGLLNLKYKMATEGTNSIVWELDFDTQEIIMSENILNIVSQKINLKENFHVLIDQLVEESMKSKLIRGIDSYLRGEDKELNFQIPIKINDNEKKWFLIRGKKILNQDKEVEKILGLLIDMTKTKEQESYINYLATHDSLTGLLNRIKFIEYLSEVLEKNSLVQFYYLILIILKALMIARAMPMEINY